MGNQHSATRYLFNGKDRTIKEIASMVGMKHKALEARLRLRGYDIDKALLPRRTRLVNLIGKTYGKLTVVSQAENLSHRVMWQCQCSCGGSKAIAANNLTSGQTKSCGCMPPASKTHGMQGTRTYTIWQDVKQRCLNKNGANSHNYIGRGIGICDKWLTFEGFYEDIGEIKVGLEVDRIDNNLGYSKENCRLATRSENCRNTRRSKRWFLFGSMYETAKEAATQLNICHTTVLRWCDGKLVNGILKGKKDDCYSEMLY